MVHGKNLSTKYWKATGRLLLSHSISWLLENFSKQTIVAFSKTYIFEALEVGLRGPLGTILGESKVCVRKNFPAEVIRRNCYKIVKVSPSFIFISF